MAQALTTLYKVCAVQAEGNSLFCVPQRVLHTPHPQRVLHTLSLYFRCASACTAHSQPVFRVCISLYYHPQPVLHTLSLYFGCASACTAHPRPVFRVCISLYCTPSACISGVHQPVLHTLSLYCTYLCKV